MNTQLQIEFWNKLDALYAAHLLRDNIARNKCEETIMASFRRHERERKKLVAQYNKAAANG